MSNERKFNIEEFDEYIHQGEPDKKEKAGPAEISGACFVDSK